MSVLTKKHPINLSLRIQDENINYRNVPKTKVNQVLKLLKGHALDDTMRIPFRDSFKAEIKKYGEPALALKGARLKEGFSQKFLAEKVGISQYNLSKMENGKRSIGKAMAKRLADVLKVDYRIFL